MLELNLFQPVFFSRDKFGCLKLSKLQFLNLALIFNFKPNGSFWLFIFKLFLLLDQIVAHLSFFNMTRIISLLFSHLNFELFCVHNTLLLLQSKFLICKGLFSSFFKIQFLSVVFSLLFGDFKPLFWLEKNLLSSGLLLYSLKFSLSSKFVLSDWVIDISRNLFSILSAFLSEFSLEIGE